MLLNRDLQGPKTTLVEVKGKICGFISKLHLYTENILRQEFHHFSCLFTCAPLDDETSVLLIVNHLRVAFLLHTMHLDICLGQDILIFP